MKALLVVLGIVGVLALMSVSSYNGLVSSEESVKGAWSEVENVYQRRADLIPNLVETVKGYAAHESETLKGVVEARAKATQTTINANDVINNPDMLNQFQQNQGALSSALSRLMVVVEKYPDLKANENFRDLQAQLEGTENRITVARMRFNETAQVFNTKIRKFPTVMLARALGFSEKAYFKAEEGANKAPSVKF